MMLRGSPKAFSSCSSGCSTTKTSRRAIVCQAAASVGREDGASCSSRREAVALGLSLLAGFAGVGKAQAVCADLDTAEAGDACRQAELRSDEASGYKGNYKNLTAGPARKTAANVPVSELGAKYVQETRDLADSIETYITIDVYDKKRQPLIKQLKSDALAWVSKYARGGSVRAQSARQIYIGVDAVLGHLASNGLAPLPSSKAKTVRDVLSEGLAFLDEGK